MANTARVGQVGMGGYFAYQGAQGAIGGAKQIANGDYLAGAGNTLLGATSAWGGYKMVGDAIPRLDLGNYSLANSYADGVLGSNRALKYNGVRGAASTGDLSYGVGSANSTVESRFGELTPAEQQTMLRVEAQEGIELQGTAVRNERPDAVWIENGKPVAGVEFTGQPGLYQNWASQGQHFVGDILPKKISLNELHKDFTVIDLTGSTEAQQMEILDAYYKLPAVQRGGIVFTGW